jgi:predicted membrane protein
MLAIVSTVITQIDVRQMRTLFYIFAICFAGLLLFVTVDRSEPNRPLAILLMILLVGITAAAVLKQLMP